MSRSRLESAREQARLWKKWVKKSKAWRQREKGRGRRRELRPRSLPLPAAPSAGHVTPAAPETGAAALPLSAARNPPRLRPRARKTDVDAQLANGGWGRAWARLSMSPEGPTAYGAEGRGPEASLANGSARMNDWRRVARLQPGTVPSRVLLLAARNSRAMLRRRCGSAWASASPDGG